MLILVLLGEIFDNPSEAPFLGLKIRNGIPIWGLIFFSYIVIIMTIFTLIPINYTNFKIYSKFETKALKRKWFYYLVGFLGLTVVFYSFCVYNVLDPVRFSNIRSLISILSVSLIIWGYMMYHGIGIKLKSE